MKRTIRFMYAVLLILLGPHGVFSSSGDIQFTIRFFDKKIYYPDSSIEIKAEIRNDSAETFRFKAASLRVYNLDLGMRTLTNIELEHSEQFTIRRNSNQPVFYREMSLEPGEEYGFVFEVSDFVKIPGPGVYVIQAFFYPELAGGRPAASIASNYLDLSVRPRSGIPEVAARIDEATGLIIQQEALPPDEVVSYMLRARQKEQWEKFFLYIDLETLMLRNPDNRVRYVRLSDEERRTMLARFRDNLRRQVIDEDIILIPSSFEILKTSYTPSEAEVKVIVKFAYSDYTEIKEYTYYLRRKDAVWSVYDYEVRNIGTE